MVELPSVVRREMEATKKTKELLEKLKQKDNHRAGARLLKLSEQISKRKTS